MRQWHCSVGGRKFGPMDADQLRRWVCEGRVAGQDMVWAEGMEAWRAASTVPELCEPAASSPATASPMLAAGPVHAIAHRGTTVLTLGILGVALCGGFGIAAWVMGRNDQLRMEAGLMDPRGYGLTVAGKTCGIVGTFFTAVMVLLYVLTFLGAELIGP